MQKAAQTGASEYLIGWVLWMADTRNANALYVFPTDRHVSEFSAARLGTAIDASEYLQELIVSGGERGADRVTFKRVRNRFLYFRGGKVELDGRAPQLKSIDADVLVLDEVDEMDTRVEPIARKRLGHSQIGHVRMVSTPTFDDLGIHAAYMQSDQRVWMLKCDACNEWQEVALANLVLESDDLERPVRWYGGATGANADGMQFNSMPLGGTLDFGTPYLACRRCFAALNRNGAGQWVAKFPERDVHGYHVHGLTATTKPLTEILNELREVNETKRQQTFNQTLGLTYASKASSRLNRSVLDKCRREYALGAPTQGNAVAGIDVGRLLHIVIRDAGHEHRALHIGTVQEFEDALALLKRFGVKVCVVDGLPETRKVREFQQHAAGNKIRVWTAFYSGEQSAAVTKEESAAWNHTERVVTLDRTRSLDEMYARFYLAAQGEPGNTLPANARDIADYYDQMVAPVRKLIDSKDGNQRAIYSEGSAADHYAHAENYCAAARFAPMPSQPNIR